MWWYDAVMNEGLRRLPSVDRLLNTPRLRELAAAHGHGLVVDAVRAVLDEARQRIRAGDAPPDETTLVEATVHKVQGLIQPTLRPLINATGVIVHTNLGRAPLSDAALNAMREVGSGYSNLEYDLEAGRRGSRYVHATALLRRITGAEAALVVNNNAAATLLILSVLAQGREVIISRGQLVEIGGGFRIPEVMAQSGARLVEVGTTNKTYIEDYARAITENTALLMRVHTSNYRIVGFTHQPSLEELVALGREHGLPVLDDLGSGSLLDTTAFGLAAEPMVQASIQAGADLVCFSGDKLLGGPQAGIIVGRAELVERIKRFPLTRALRVDKVTLAGLQATLLAYLRGTALQEIPVWRMIATPVEALERRARAWAEALQAHGISTEVVEGHSAVGGGSLPGETLPTRLLALRVASPHALAARLRAADPPVIARIERERLLLDPRTVLPEQDETLIEALSAACCASGEG